jgi:hypothetical protein
MCQDRVRRGLSGRPFVKLKPDWTGPNMTTEPAHEASWVIPQQIQILFALSRCVEFFVEPFRRDQCSIVWVRWSRCRRRGLQVHF